MNYFQVKNYRQALYYSLQAIRDHGNEISPRGMQTKELENVLYEIECPQDKISILKHRNANIFATLAETLWVLGGRNDLEFISHYIKRMEDFADPENLLYGGYGPRIQKWQGVNQFEQVLNILKKDPTSRRAIISLFDPSRDFFSDDLPCTNWLHFTIRDDKLNLKIVSRSMDVIWGSTLNFFEWAVVQEIVANWLGVNIGKLYYFVSSLHIYEPFYDRMNMILSEPINETEYYYNSWNIPFDIFNEEITAFFLEEEKMRYMIEPDLKVFKTNIISISTQLLWSYNLHKKHEFTKAIEVIRQCPNCAMKDAGLDFYKRNLNYKKLI